MRKFNTKEEVIEEYDNVANSYDSNRSITFEGKVVDKLQINLIKSYINEYDCEKVLEVGCGTGRILIPVSKDLFFKPYGIDSSNNMLNILRQKNSSYINIRDGDIENIPLRDDSFDCTYTMHVLMHLPSFNKAFKEMYRVTKKGGIIICDFPNKGSPWTKLSILLNPNKKRTNLFSVEQLKEYFKEYNFKVTGLFSYARSFYKIPILKYLIYFMEKYLPLPIFFRTQLIVIVKK